MSKTNKTSKNDNEAGKQKTVRKKSKAELIAIKVGRGALTVLLICVIAGCIAAGAITLYVMTYVKAYPINLSDAKLKFTSMVYANDSSGNTVKVAELSGVENRVWVDLKDTPKDLSDAIISTEDQRFYEHEGVDWKRTIGASANLIFHFDKTSYGGSTITQQLVKNIEGNVDDRTIGIKLKEIRTALVVEKQYTKDTILETYINTIPLGNGCYGVQTAANLYFGKDVKDLDLAQCALLAGIIQSPNGDEPYNHSAKAISREKYVLQNMLDQKMITQAQYTAAVNEKLTFVPIKKTIRSWFVDKVINDVTSDLMSQKGYTKDYAQALIFTQGLQIYTTENTAIQADMDQVYNNDSYKYLFKGSGGTYFQSGMMILNYKGQIVGMEGGQGAKTGDMMLDRTQTNRQPGSSIKPIGVYGPAIEDNLIDWSSMFLDGPVIPYNGSLTPNWPKDDEAYTNVNMTVNTALTESRNTVAVRVEQLLKPINTYNFLTNKLGFTSLTKDDAEHLGISLGMLDKGVSVEEMAGAYEIYGDGGVYTKPYTYTKVLDANGNVLLQNNSAATQVLSPGTATIVNKMMQNVVYSGGGTGIDAKISGVPIAGKTGTTSDNKDRWWIGDTPEYVGAVWTGYDQPKSMGGIANPAVNIWRDIMQLVEKGRNSASQFPVSGDVVQEPYDVATGSLNPAGTAEGWYSVNDQAVQNLQNGIYPAISSSSSQSSIPSDSSGDSSDDSSSSSSGTGSSSSSSPGSSSTPLSSSSSQPTSSHHPPGG